MERDSRIEIEPIVWEAVEKIAEAEGASVADYVNRAVLESLRHSDPVAYWKARGARARPGAFLDLLARAGDEPPRPGDELPEGWRHP